MAGMEEGLDVEEAERRMLAGGKDTADPSKSSGDAGEASNSKGKDTDRSGRRTDGPTNGVLDITLIQSDPNKLYPLIYHALKNVLKEWEQAMAERPGKTSPLFRSELVVLNEMINPDQIKRSTQGKLAAATQVSSAEYLKPLFKSLKQRVSLSYI